MFDVRSRRKTFFMSANKTTKKEKGKKRKKITLNSRISPLEKDTIISSFFVLCFVKGGTFLSFFSPTAKGGLSHPNTHHRHPISLSLFLSLFYYTNICISENNNNNAPKNSPQLRARIHVARELFYVWKRERGTQHKIGSQTQKIEREKRKKSLLSSL